MSLISFPYRFRVRDIPGVVEPHIFKQPALGRIRNTKIKISEEEINISYDFEDAQKVGYTNQDVIQSKSLTDVSVNINNFSLTYTVGSEERLKIPEGSFIFETESNVKIIEILLENTVSSKDKKQLEKIFKACYQNYEFKEYIEEIPNGPSSLGLSLEFIKHSESNFSPKLMGLCHRITDNLDFQPTMDYESGERLTNPHRIFNSDHFSDDYPNVGLYGSIPLLYSIESNNSTGVIMLNSSDSLIDFMQKGENQISEWTSESGVLDLYIFSSGNIEENAQKVTEFSGKAPMPLETALGHHQ